MGVVVRCADAVLDERANLELPQPLAESGLVVPLVRSESPQIARIPAGDLLAEVGVTSFECGRTVYVEDSLGFCIDEFRDFERLYAVVGAVAVMAAGAVSVIECGVEGGVFGWIVQLRRLAQ
jgi:hypothetical protein